MVDVARKKYILKDFRGKNKIIILEIIRAMKIVCILLIIIIPQIGIIFWIVERIKILFHLIFSKMI